MFINYAQLKKNPFKTIKYDLKGDLGELEWLINEDGTDGRGMVEVKIDALYNEASIFLSGSIKAVFTLECSRCLEMYNKSVFYDFNDELKVVYSEGGKEKAVLVTEEEASEESYFIKGDTIDLREYFRQLFFISQDMKPLCKVECMGICSICGTNRNSVECNCKTDNFDIRLAGLKELKIKLNENNRRN